MQLICTMLFINLELPWNKSIAKLGPEAQNRTPSGEEIFSHLHDYSFDSEYHWGVGGGKDSITGSGRRKWHGEWYKMAFVRGTQGAKSTKSCRKAFLSLFKVIFCYLENLDLFGFLS